jgi:hypothetical protein
VSTEGTTLQTRSRKLGALRALLLAALLVEVVFFAAAFLVVVLFLGGIALSSQGAISREA